MDGTVFEIIFFQVQSDLYFLLECLGYLSTVHNEAPFGVSSAQAGLPTLAKAMLPKLGG